MHNTAIVTESKYELILGKLRQTIDRFKGPFPQLCIIEEFLAVDLPSPINERDCIKRLEELCLFLNHASTNSYLIRHLYHNLCKDVEAFKGGNELPSEGDVYLDLPGGRV